MANRYESMIYERLEGLEEGLNKSINGLKEIVRGTMRTPIDPIKGYRLNWAEKRQRAKDQKDLGALMRRQGNGRFHPGGDSIRVVFMQGIGYMPTLRRGKRP